LGQLCQRVESTSVANPCRADLIDFTAATHGVRLKRSGTLRLLPAGVSRCIGAKPFGKRTLRAQTANGTNCRQARPRDKRTESCRNFELSGKWETWQGWPKPVRPANCKKTPLSIAQHEESALNTIAKPRAPHDPRPPRSMRMCKAHNLAAGEHGETVGCLKTFRAPVHQLGFNRALRICFASEPDFCLGRAARPSPPFPTSNW